MQTLSADANWVAPSLGPSEAPLAGAPPWPLASLSRQRFSVGFKPTAAPPSLTSTPPRWLEPATDEPAPLQPRTLPGTQLQTSGASVASPLLALPELTAHWGSIVGNGKITPEGLSPPVGILSSGPASFFQPSRRAMSFGSPAVGAGASPRMPSGNRDSESPPAEESASSF